MATPSLVAKKMVRFLGVITKGPGSKAVGKYRCNRKMTRGSGVVALGSKMIDPPVVKRAQKTIELATKLNS